MKRRALLASLAAASVLGPRFAFAAPPVGPRRIAILLHDDGRCEKARQSHPLSGQLAKLGHVDGRDVTVEWHCTTGEYERAKEVAAQVVRRGVDIFYTQGTPLTRILQKATRTIPIVTGVGDPIASGFTRSLARPDANITGMCDHPDAAAKQVELLGRLVPKLWRLVIIGMRQSPHALDYVARYEAAARAAGIVPEVKLLELSGFDQTFSEMKGVRGQAALITYVPSEMGEIAKVALRHGVPTLYAGWPYVEHGGLMSFQMQHGDRLRSEVAIFDKLLRGVKPADIPWELPGKSHLAINLRTARALGLAVPPDLLVRADQVVE